MIVRQAENVLQLLEHFAKVKQPLSLADIAEAMEWPRSSTFNLLTTLEHHGFLYQPRPRKGYYPTPRWMSLLKGISETELLPDEICRATQDVASETGETAAVAAPAGTNAVLLYVVESAAPVRFSAEVGYQVPIHATSTGRALLAQYTSSERASVLKKVNFVKYSHRSLMSADQVEAEIKRAVKRGWHENIEGHSVDLIGVAMPVALPDRCLSLVVGGPSSRMRQRVPQIAAILKRQLQRHLTRLRASERA